MSTATTIAMHEHPVRPRPTSTERAPTKRRATTRAAVLEAARDCIRQEGVDGATAAKITKRCGLSWGVIQYHFGDRTGIFLALLEEGWATLDKAYARLESDPVSPAARLRGLVDEFWSLVSHDDFRVLLEVQLQLSRGPTFAERIRKQAPALRRRLRDVWRRALPEFPKEQVDRAERLVTTSLRGLALEWAIDGPRRVLAAERAVITAAAMTILGIEEP